MSQPNVNLNETDGAIGTQNPGKIVAFLGPAAGGPIAMPAAYARTKNLVQDFVSGPLVEGAGFYIDQFNAPAVVCRATSATAGQPGTPDVTGVTGTSVITLTGTPNDDYEAQLKVVKGGTLGSPGIVIQYSLDGGRNWSEQISLGTALLYAVPGAGLTFNFAAGTLVASDIAKTRTLAPAWDTAALNAALVALKNSTQNIGLIIVLGPLDSNAVDALETQAASMESIGKTVAWIGHTRMPNVAEAEASYLTAMVTALGTKATTHGAITFGAAKVTSPISGRKYKRPIIWPVGALQGAQLKSQNEQQNIAELGLGSLKGVSIADINGNPDEHDETLFPGADDARFIALRTWNGRPGVYVNRPRLFSAPGSDFELIPHRLVMNIARQVIRGYLELRCNKDVLVNPTTGFILEEEALEIENGVLASLRAALRAKPKASGVRFQLSRSDNLLSTKTFNGVAGILPLAYPEFINIDIGFYNPALLVQTA